MNEQRQQIGEERNSYNSLDFVDRRPICKRKKFKNKIEIINNNNNNFLIVDDDNRKTKRKRDGY